MPYQVIHLVLYGWLSLLRDEHEVITRGCDNQWLQCLAKKKTGLVVR